MHLSLNFGYLGIWRRKYLPSRTHPGTEPPQRVPALTVAALSRYRPPVLFNIHKVYFSSSFSRRSAATLLPSPLNLFSLITIGFPKRTSIPFKLTLKVSPQNALASQFTYKRSPVPAPRWRFIGEIIFDLLTIAQLLFSLKPIKADVRYRVQTL